VRFRSWREVGRLGKKNRFTHDRTVETNIDMTKGGREGGGVIVPSWGERREEGGRGSVN